MHMEMTWKTQTWAKDGVSRKHGCCHWRSRCASSPTHKYSTYLIFSFRVHILNFLSCCSNSSSLFLVAFFKTFCTAATRLSKDGTYTLPSVTVDRRQLSTIHLYQNEWIQEIHALKNCSKYLYHKSPCSISTWFISMVTFQRNETPPRTLPTPPWRRRTLCPLLISLSSCFFLLQLLQSGQYLFKLRSALHWHNIGTCLVRTKPITFVKVIPLFAKWLQIQIGNKIENNWPVSDYRRYRFILNRKQ